MPWGMEYDFPVDTFQQTSFSQNMMEPYGQSPTQTQSPFTSAFGDLFGPNRTPALTRYQDYIQNFPQQQDYQGGIGTKILAAIAGFASGMKDPASGIKTSLDIMQTPYRNAVSQYGLMEGPLRQAASLEDKALGDKIAWVKAQQQMQVEKMRAGLEGQKFGLEQQKFGLDQQKLALDQAQLKLDQAYKMGQISNDQYQNATARINAMANQQQSAASAEQSKAMAGFYQAKTANPQAFMSQGSDNSNASMIKMQINNELRFFPELVKALQNQEPLTESQQNLLRSIYQKYGVNEEGVYE